MTATTATAWVLSCLIVAVLPYCHGFPCAFTGFPFGCGLADALNPPDRPNYICGQGGLYYYRPDACNNPNCAGSQQVCLCDPGWAGRRENTLDNANTANAAYHAGCDIHCTRSIAQDYCGAIQPFGYPQAGLHVSHGDPEKDGNGQVIQYLDYKFEDVTCRCHNGWVGFPTWLPGNQCAPGVCSGNTQFPGPKCRGNALDEGRQCQINIAIEYCNKHGQHESGVTLMAKQEHDVVCVCDAGWMPSGKEHGRNQCNQRTNCPAYTGPLPDPQNDGCGPHGYCDFRINAVTGSTRRAPICNCTTGYGTESALATAPDSQRMCCPKGSNGQVCGGRGVCLTTGECQCSNGPGGHPRGGKYCCPRMPDEVLPCNGRGTCQSDGTCLCEPGFIGHVCEASSLCPSDTAAQPCPSLASGQSCLVDECSGEGRCRSEDGGEYLINRMRFVDTSLRAITIAGVAFQDEGIASLMLRWVTNWADGNFTRFRLRYPTLATSCIGQTGRIACFRFMLTHVLQAELRLKMITLGNDNERNSYVDRVMVAEHPTLNGNFNATYMTSLRLELKAVGVSAGANASRAHGIAAAMAYLLLQNPDFPDNIKYPPTQAHRCECEAVHVGREDAIGSDIIGGGEDCGTMCLLGLNGQACSGFDLGQIRGRCSRTGDCICGPLWGGIACQDYLGGTCVEHHGSDAFPCESTGTGRALHGTCVEQSFPVSSHSCECTALWNSLPNEYCAYSSCTPTGETDENRRLECLGKGECFASGNCVCDVYSEVFGLRSSNGIPSPPPLPAGHYCQLDGFTQCATSVAQIPSGFLYSECSTHGKCVGDTSLALHCLCDRGYFGTKCEFTQCHPDAIPAGCNENSNCNNSTGQCECKPRWANPPGCTMPPTVLPSPKQVLLGRATPFAILAGSTITFTVGVPTNVTGSVGLHPGSSITGPYIVTNGTTEQTTTAAAGAKTDLTAAYNDAAGRTTLNTLVGDLGGRVLTAGVYKYASSGQLTGVLILDGQNNPNAVFIFQFGTTLITASASSVVLINGARTCNVFWQVGSSATIGSTTIFKGSILALTSITVSTSATIDGRLLARNGATTFDRNRITRTSCPPATVYGQGNCDCSVPLCGHGEPDGTGTQCICDAHFTRDNLGKCTVVQCPLVVLSIQGERACQLTGKFPPDVICNDIENALESFTDGCCYDQCGSACRYNASNAQHPVRCTSCPGGLNIAYEELDGICYSRCHGGGAEVTSHGYSCLCDAQFEFVDLADDPNDAFHPDRAYVDPLTCEINVCRNGGITNRDVNGVPISCNCATAGQGGKFCTEDVCEQRGTPNMHQTACTCFEPYINIAGDVRCLHDTCGVGGIVEVVLEGNPEEGIDPIYQCSVPGNLLKGTDGAFVISGRPLDCEGVDAVNCSRCLHDSIVYVADNVIKCDCIGTPYIGEFCETLVCSNDGILWAHNNTQTCNCTYPFAGLACLEDVCVGGSTPIASVEDGPVDTCGCIFGSTGDFCEVPFAMKVLTPVPPLSSTGAGHATSSTGLSSTAAAAVLNATDTTDHDALLNNVKIWVPVAIAAVLVVGFIVVVIVNAVGTGVAVGTGSAAAAGGAVAGKYGQSSSRSRSRERKPLVGADAKRGRSRSRPRGNDPLDSA